MLRRPLSSQLTLAFVVLNFAGLMAMTAFVVMTMGSVDAEAGRQQAMSMERALNDAVDRFATEHRAIVDAIASVQAVDRSIDIGRSISAALRRDFGHDVGFLLRSDSTPILVDGAEWTDYATAVRAFLLRGWGRDTVGYVAGPGGPMLLSVHPIPGNGAGMLLHVSLLPMDDAFAGSLADGFDARMIAPGASPASSIPILDTDGRELARLAWRPALPGSLVLKDILPYLLCLVVVAMAFNTALLRRLHRASGDLQEREERSSFLAQHDTLTSLPNRRLFAQRLVEALRRARTDDDRAGVLFLDLDRFKSVNDTLGHAAGDALIKQVATRLSLLVRPQDTVARLGGDEFAVVLDGDAPTAGRVLARRAIEAMARPFDIHGEIVCVAASVGLATGDDPDDVDSLWQGADAALYEAKRDGGSRFATDRSPIVRLAAIAA